MVLSGSGRTESCRYPPDGVGPGFRFNLQNYLHTFSFTMNRLLTAFLAAFSLSVAGQGYTFPNIGETDVQQVRTTIDTLFAGIRIGHVPLQSITGPQKELTRDMLEYLKNRQGEGISHEIVNCYPLDSQNYRVMVACSNANVLQQLYTVDVRLDQARVTVDLPLWHDTRTWSSDRTGTIHYYYDHDFDAGAARDFNETNRRIAGKLGLPVDSFDFYLSDNYQQIIHWMGLTYDRLTAGQTRDGFIIGHTIFAICHNEDFSHDLVHYYVYKVRKAPRNPYAEEGVAYYWGNAYYPDGEGRMISLGRLKADLRDYLATHPDVDWLTLFQKNQRGVFGPAKEVSVRSTLSGIIAENIEKNHGLDGILRLLNCGAGEEDYFRVTGMLAGIDSANFNRRIPELLNSPSSR